jgi:hypothetical protein
MIGRIKRKELHRNHSNVLPETFGDIRRQKITVKQWEMIYRATNVRDAIKKGKTLPLQAWTGPEGSRKLRLPDFKTVGTLR